MITSPNIQAEATDRLNNGVLDLVGAGAPTNGSTGTGAGFAGPGSLYYDLTNQILYNQSGTLLVPVWAPCSLTDNTSTVSGTVQNTEYTLNSVTIPANFLKGKRGISVEFWGTTAANANAKNLKIYVGATAVVTVTGSTASGKDYYGAVTLVRTGASTQTGVGTLQVDTAVASGLGVNGAIAETDTADIIVSLKTANTAAAAASATGKGASGALLGF